MFLDVVYDWIGVLRMQTGCLGARVEVGVTVRGEGEGGSSCEGFLDGDGDVYESRGLKLVLAGSWLEATRYAL